MKSGLSIRLEGALTSELLVIEAIEEKKKKKKKKKKLLANGETHAQSTNTAETPTV